jgi:hypothetical protein
MSNNNLEDELNKIRFFQQICNELRNIRDYLKEVNIELGDEIRGFLMFVREIVLSKF